MLWPEGRLGNKHLSKLNSDPGIHLDFKGRCNKNVRQMMFEEKFLQTENKNNIKMFMISID